MRLPSHKAPPNTIQMLAAAIRLHIKANAGSPPPRICQATKSPNPTLINVIRMRPVRRGIHPSWPCDGWAGVGAAL